MSAADVLAEADRNLREAWESIVVHAPRPGRAELDGGLLALSSGIPVSLFNPAYVVGEVTDPTAAVEAIVAHYAALGLPSCVVFREEVAPGLAEACESAGLVEHWRLPLMVLDPIPATAPATVDGLEIAPVDESTVEAYGDVLSAGFGMPRDLAATVLGAPLLLDTPGFTGFLGTLDGEPVGASGVFVTGETAGVYNVATVEPARGRGVGAAMTWAAAVAGRHAGATRSVLQASQQGEPVYARMGYETPVRYRQFETVVPPPPPTPS